MKISKFFLGLGLVMMLFMSNSRAQPKQKKPNIVFLFADDWGRYASIYNEWDDRAGVNSVINTPNFDRIAEDGVLFTRAYAPAPSCTPCRSSILSGQYFYRTGQGTILHGAQWDASIPSYPLILEEHGYHIGFTYKCWSPGTPRDAPYGAKANEYETAGTRFNRFSQFVSNATNPDKAKQELLDEVEGNFEAFLKDRKPGQPFCYWFGPTNTHRSWIQGSGKDLWGLEPDRLKGRMPDFLPDVPVIREDFNDYLGEVLAWDAAIGVMFKKLRQTSELNNTLVVISGDHGIPGFPRAKTNLYDLGTAVALAAYWPEKIEAGQVSHAFVNLMDLAPTFLEAGGIEPPEVMNGKSLIPLLTGKDEEISHREFEYVLTGRERHVATAREDNLPYPQRALRVENYLYIRNFTPWRWPIGTLEKGLRDIDNGPTKSYFVRNHDNPEIQEEWALAFGKRPYEELYDLNEDPGQMHNVAGKKGYGTILEQLSGQMDSVLRATGDPRINTFDRMPYTITNERLNKRQKEVEQYFEKMIEKNYIK